MDFTEYGRIHICTLFLHNKAIHENQQYFKQFVCVEVLRPSQPNGVMSSMVSLPNHTFTKQVNPLNTKLICATSKIGLIH